MTPGGKQSVPIINELGLLRREGVSEILTPLAVSSPLSAGRGGVPCRGSPLSLTSFGSSPAGGAKCQPVVHG